MKNRRITLLLLFAVLFAVSCGKKERLAATVGDKKIAVAEVEDMVKRYVSVSKKLDTLYREPSGLLLENMRRQFLNGVIDRILILEQAGALNLAVTEEELDAKINLLRKDNNTILEEESFNKYLAEQGMTKEKFRLNIREIMLMEKFRDRIASELTVADSEIQAYYGSHQADYAREVVDAAHILVAAPEGVKDVKSLEARAAEAASKARSGEDFAKLARKYSDDPGSGKRGGGLGAVTRGDMVGEFDAALFGLKKNEVAGPVRTQFGFHVIKALSDPRREVRPLADVKDAIRRTVVSEKIKQRLGALRQGKEIKILWDFKK